MTQVGAELPSQSLGLRRKEVPEQRLMAAVLHNALNCVETYRFATTNRGRRLFHETKQWFLAADADWLYSFERICEVLGLDSDAVRQRLRIGPEYQPVPVSRARVVLGWDDV